MLYSGELPGGGGKFQAAVTARLSTDVKKGVRVPEVLRRYIPGAPEVIPYTKELPKDSTSQKPKGKGEGGTKEKVGAAVNSVTKKLEALK